MEGREVSDGAKTRVLNGVPRVLLISQEIPCQRERRIKVRQNRRLERWARVDLHVLPRNRPGAGVTAIRWLPFPSYPSLEQTPIELLSRAPYSRLRSGRE